MGELDPPINVLSIIQFPVFGGPHNRMALVAKLLEPEGIRTTIVVPEEGGDAAQRLRDRGVDVVTLPLHRMRVSKSASVHAAYARTLRSEVRALAALIRERDIHVVATNTLPNVHGPLAARRAKVACVWQIIDTRTPLPVRCFYMPMVFRMADVVMTTGVKVARGHPGMTRLGDRWMNFFPCVDVAKFRADASIRASAREELGLPGHAHVIGNVSVISAMKGPETFIRAAAELRKTRPETRFVILGSQHHGRDRYYARLWSLAGSLGLVLGEHLVVRDPGDRVHELAQSFDVLWVTSRPRSEGIPTVIGEAKALGIPVVTTDVGSCSECVANGRSGYVVPARDPVAIASRTGPLLDDDSLRAQMGACARDEAVRDFAAENGAETHRIAFERAIEHHRSKARRAT